METAENSGERLVALLHGSDQPGLVARTANWIYERGGNILHADQHRDDEEGVFLQRIEWVPAGGIEEDSPAFTAFAESLGMTVRVASTRTPARVARSSEVPASTANSDLSFPFT